MTLTTALMSCTALGLQHGIDWDHVAAISDVASIQPNSREATRCGLLYAAGHAGTVGILGLAVIVLRPSVPDSLSLWMQKIVGFTLILLSSYVFAAIFSGSGPQSRGQAVAAILSKLHWGKRKEDALENRGYGPRSSMTLGVLHGIGAETPTQLSMLVITTNLGTLSNGALGLLVFAMGMFISNMALTTIATGAFTISRPRPVLFRWLGAITAGYSLWIGVFLIFSPAGS